MSDRFPVPRYHPDDRAHPPVVERRGRLLMLAGGGLLLALVASSVVNATRASLRCVDGQLIAFRGSLMPAGEEPLDDPTLPPLPVPAAACDDEELASLSELRARHREITRGRVDQAMRQGEREVLQSSALEDALGAMVEPAGDDDEGLQQRRALLQSIVDAKVERAHQSQQDALRWIEQARRAGVDPARLRAAERILGLPGIEAAPTEPPPGDPAEPLAPEDDTSAETPGVLTPTAPRSL